MPADNHLSPEVDILDQLQGGPMALPLAVSVFHDVKRACRAFRFLASEGAVEFVTTEKERDRPLQQWEVHRLLEGLAASTPSLPAVRLRLTDKGHRKWAEDSAGFFHKLFST